MAATTRGLRQRVDEKFSVPASAYAETYAGTDIGGDVATRVEAHVGPMQGPMQGGYAGLCSPRAAATRESGNGWYPYAPERPKP